MPAPNPTYVSVREAARILRVKPWSVLKLCERGALRSQRVIRYDDLADAATLLSEDGDQ